MFTRISNDPLSQKLNLLLTQPLENLYEQEMHLYDEFAGSFSNSLVLFGAGGLGKKTLNGLRRHGIEPLAFVDNNVNLYGEQVDGLTVLPPKIAAQEYGHSALFLITVYTDSAPGGIEPIIQTLQELGCQKIISFIPLFWKYSEEFLPHYVYDLPHRVIDSSNEILEAFNLFHDPTSREEFFAQISWRLNPTYANVPPQSMPVIYFPPDLIKLTTNEVFIDCGAYNGDTMQSFLEHTSSRFNRLIAFEPDPTNFKRLVEVVNLLPNKIGRRIRTYNRALGRDSKKLRFNAQGHASSSLSERGEFIIECERLDTLIRDEVPTFIKMDIEGAELDALYGAEEQISKHLPILAISAYHAQDHIWRIPIFLRSISESYQFFLRRYSPRFLDDLVLYAVPNNRIQN